MKPPITAIPPVRGMHLHSSSGRESGKHGVTNPFQQALGILINQHGQPPQPEILDNHLKSSYIQSRATQIGVEKIIHKAAQTYGLDPNVIASVINAQSNFNPNAVSPAGAEGLMQLMPATAAELGITDAFDPEQNIMGASRYLKSLVDRYDGDLKLALKAYTWGMGNVDRNLNSPPVEVEMFVAKVTAASTDILTAQRPTATVLTEISQLNPMEEKQTFEFKYDVIQQKARQSGVGSIIQQAAQTYGLNPNLIAAVINAESNFDKHAVSHAGAQGLMQLMPATAVELGVTNPFDPEQNIMGASRYLKSLVNRYEGDLSLALAAYNWGMGNLERHPGRLPAETSNYIAKVLALIPTEMKHESTTVATVGMTPAKQIARNPGQAEPSPGNLQTTTRQAVLAYARDPSLIETAIWTEKDISPKASV